MALIPSLSKAWQMYIPSGGNHVANGLSSISKTWEAYSPSERRNIAMYIAGVILYRFGLEVFDGSMITMALDRFAPEHTFEKVGALAGINQAMQCIGAILIVRAPNFPLTVGATGQDNVYESDPVWCCHSVWSVYNHPYYH
jgi:hypothetical protein